jgi:SPP1 family predicted phage head-tail adaptor
MRAGDLDRVITINAPTVTPDANGAPQTTWAQFAYLRAQLLSRSTAEIRLRELGEETGETTVFRIRWLDGITLAMQVAYNGDNYRILDVREIGRRIGQDLTCLKVTT